MKLLNASLLSWGFLSRKTKLYFVFAIFLMPIIALVELIQVATIVPMMNLLTGGEGKISLGGIQINASLLDVAVFFALISLIVSSFRFLGLYTSNYASLKSLEDISTSVFMQRIYGEFSDAKRTPRVRYNEPFF